MSELTGISIRTLQYYDKIGLLKPTEYTKSGYRLYDDNSLKILQQILLFRELEFPLKEIKRIIYSSSFDRNKALEQQIELLTLKREHINNLINFANQIKMNGGNDMSFSAFDTKKIEEYAKQAKEQWENTVEYKEFEEKFRNRAKDDEKIIVDNFMKIFVRFGEIKNQLPDSTEAQNLTKELKNYITNNYYKCSNEILLSLSAMYSVGGEFTENIDNAGGNGTAEFVTEAIKVYCEKNKK